MRAIAITVLLGVTASALTPDLSLTADRRSRRTGEIVTVRVEEAARAANDARTRTTSDNAAELSVGPSSGLLGWIPGAGMQADFEAGFRGEGTTSRQATVDATVSAMVMEVLPGGVLRIEGTKEVLINDETELLVVSGLVRAEDVGPDNTVSSARLADARIRYSGRGDTGSAARKGWFARFWDWLL